MHSFRQALSATFLATMCLGLALVGGIGLVAAAPPVPGVPAERRVSADEIDAKIKELEAAQDIEEGVKGKQVELYRQALRYLETTRSNESAAKAFEAARDTAPAKTADLRKQLEQAEEKPVTLESLKISDKTPLGDLEQRLVKEKADLAALEAKLSEIEKALSDEKSRPTQIRERLTELKQTTEEIDKQLKAPAPPDEAAGVTKARTVGLELRRRKQRAEIHMLDQELLSQGVRVDLLKAQRDRTSRSVANVRQGHKLLEDLVNRRRVDEAEKAQAAAAEAEREAVGKHPAIRRLAEHNTELTRELASLTADLERVTKRRETVIAQAKDIKRDFQTAEQRLAIAGLSETLGRILIEQRRKLPDLRQYRKDMAARKERISQVGLREVQAEEENRDLRDIDAASDALLAEQPGEALPPNEVEVVRRELHQGIKDRKVLLEQASNTYGTYLKALAALDYAEEQLLDAAGGYAGFLDEHLLWLPSAPPVNLQSLEDLFSAVGWLLSPGNWLGVGRVLLADSADAPLVALVALLPIVVLLWNGRRLRSALVRLAEKVRRLSTDSIALTFQALGITLLLSVAWPALVAFLGWRLQVAPDAGEFVRNVGTGLSFTAPALLNLLVFRRFCAKGGIADKHFRWREPSLKLLRRNLDLLIVAALPTLFVTTTAGAAGEATYRDSLSRLGFAIIMALLVYFFWRVLNPRHGILASHIRANPKGWVARLRYAWYAAVLGMPLALVALEGLGYFHTAGQLARQMVNTLWLILALVILHDLVIRWLTLARRKLALQQLREKRAAERAARKAEQTGETGGQPPPEVVEEKELDLEAIDAQTRKLLHVAIALSAAVWLWLIWSSVFPALGILEQVSLWQQTVTVEGTDTLVPVTLADLMLALVIGLLTVAAAKNLPGVMEIVLLQSLALSAGSRYAVTTLTQYTIVAVGVILAFNTIGASWSSIQWLVAALSVGLGFGLQEIVANFISGIILLFERPIRVGDIVTVGDTTGIVSRIRIRATTIRNWDKQELLVPNKEFITGRLLNWTLSDQMNRIVITVGVAYGTDVQKAMALIAEAAAEHERVLEDPPPMITFEGFGDNALTLLIRCYLDSLEFRLLTITELHTAINKKFNDAGIVIAFPQRDVYLDTTRPLEVRIRKDDDSH